MVWFVLGAATYITVGVLFCRLMRFIHSVSTLGLFGDMHDDSLPASAFVICWPFILISSIFFWVGIGVNKLCEKLVGR